MKLRVPLLLLGLVTSACLVADCGGDDTGDSTPGTGGSAGKGGSGGSSGHGGGIAGSLAGSAGSLAGVGGFAGSVGGSGGSAGTAGSGGSAGSAGAPGSDAGDGAAGSPAEAGVDAAKEAGVDATSSTDAGTDATGADAADATSADVSTSVDASDAAAQSDGAADDGASSDATDAGVGVLVINEIVSNPLDYVEFYNKGGAPIDISNWYFTDNNPDGGSDHFYVFPAGTIVPSHGFYLATAAADAGTHFMTVGLGSADSVILRDNLGNLIEQENWTEHRLGDSRCPDGTGVFNNPDGGTNNRPQTPGAPNSCP